MEDVMDTLELVLLSGDDPAVGNLVPQDRE